MNIPKPNVSVVTSRVGRVFAMSKMKLALIVLVILVLGGLGYVVWRAIPKKPSKQVVIMNGKEYVVEDFSTQNLKENATEQAKTDYQAEILELKQRIQASGANATYQDFLTLAQLYVSAGDKENAIKNYEIVKAKLDPKSTDYKEFSAQIDGFITELRKAN